MVLAKVLSQAGKWGWFAEVEMDYLDTGASTLRTKSPVFRGTFLIPSLSKCWRGLSVLLEWCQDCMQPDQEVIKTADFSLAFALGVSDP